MSAKLTPDDVAHVEQYMAGTDIEVDRLLYVYEQLAKEHGDVQAVLNLGAFLATDWSNESVTAIATMAIRRISRGTVDLPPLEAGDES